MTQIEEARRKAKQKHSLAIRRRKERDELLAALRFLVDAVDNDKSTVLSLQHAKFLLRRYPRKI
jgi:hypothetical protein